MEEFICYFNGQYMKESEVRVSLWDTVFTEGNIYDVGRTYNRIPLFWREHIDRWFRSLRSVYIDIGLSAEEVYNITLEVFKRNERKLAPEDEFIIIHRATRGVMPAFAMPPSSPSVLIYGTSLIPLYKRMAKYYQEGIHLIIANTRQIPPQCLDPKIKHTNRLCNTLAALEAKRVDPQAFALMLDINGLAAEGPLYSFFMVRGGKLLAPKTTNCLEGITRGAIIELAGELNIEFAEADLTVHDLNNADEMFITANSFILYPVVKFNNIELPKPIPSAITKQLISAFSKKIGVDFVQRVVDYVHVVMKQSPLPT